MVIVEPNIYQNLGDLTRMWDFTWRVSDCEELSGGYSQKMRGLMLRFYFEDSKYEFII